MIELGFNRRPKLPVYMASEAAECGLVCLAMIARYHGHDVDVNGLRQRFAFSITGATLKSIMEIADKLSLTTRPLRVELPGLVRLKTPAILHWNMNHFVVLKRATSKSITIHDPSRGVITYSMEEVSRHFTGVALELAPAGTFEPIQARTPVKISSLWSSLRGFWTGFGQILILTATLQVMTFLLPFQIQLVVDEAIYGADMNLLGVIAVGFGLLILFQQANEVFRSWALQIFSQQVGFQIVGNIIHHMTKLPTSFFEKRALGDILSRMGSANQIQQVLTQGTIASILDGVMAIAAAIILFAYSPTLATIVVASVALNMLIAWAFFPIMRRRQEEEITESAREQNFLMETIRSITPIKMMGREAVREAGWRNLYAGVINKGLSNTKWMVGLSALQGTVNGIQTVAIVYLAARSVIAGDGFSIGMLYAFLSFRQTFSDRMTTLIDQAMQFRFLGLHLDRLSDIITSEPERSDDLEGDLIVDGAVAARGLGFRYGATDPLVLNDINLDIAPGEFVAITGRSGGGKTTLLKVLLGQLQPTEGEVLLDGQRATVSRWKAWRQSVGIVSQDDELISGTIADNIGFFDPDLDMGRVHEAAKSAQIHDEISRMPMQYLSLVGDMGSALSGGQKQRILLARALYRQPKILVLDEGTANLDVHTEEIIATLIRGLPITRIIVAHRPALIDRADRTLLMRDGQLEPMDPVRPVRLIAEEANG